MDRAQLTFQTAPQTVTIGLDQALAAAVADMTIHIGTLIGEVRAQREMMERLVVALEAESAARAEWDRTQSAIAQSLMPSMTQNTAPDDTPIPEMAPDALPDQTPQEGAVNAATAVSTPAQSATGVAFTKPMLDQVYAEIEPRWFVGGDGGNFIRGENGEPDRRATAIEDAAIRADQRKGRRGGRRR
jgi:hypothetical protein